jgi:phage tail sheath protein FI
MAETIVSPGVLAIENDQSFITQGPVTAGAAIVGPTVKGKVGIPTIVTSYSDYLNKFGSTFISGSQTYTYFTSISAYNYFNNGGTSLLVTRVVSGSFTPATSSTIPTSTAATSASANVDLTFISASLAAVGSGSFNVNGVTLYYTGSGAGTVVNNSSIIYINTSSFAASTVANYVVTSSQYLSFSSSLALYSSSLQYISSSVNSPNLVLTFTGSNGLIGNSSYYISGSTTAYFSGGTNTEAFVLETLSSGDIMNSTGPTGSYGTLLSGSADNFRWQITNTNINNGTFTLVIRQGNDSVISPSILETWTNLSLDPFASNYIEKVIGNQTETVQYDPTTGEYYIELVGNYQNRSRYVRVKQVKVTTPNYLDNLGTPKPEYTGSICYLSSGSFGNAVGKNTPTGTAGNYYENISNTNIQGLTANAYTQSISLLANQDAYNYNLLTIPGLIADSANYPSHISVINSLISTVQNRGDAMTVIDLVGYGANVLEVTSNATGYDTSYAASYWPWVKTIDPNTGTQVWVPASTMIPGVYAFNDNVAEPWFAPAGINRGVLTNVIQAERSLTQGNRDLLYESNVNSIATFPNTGVVVFGQKTLQKKPSALDRVNVRRLLIELKNYISQVADTLVFEQNNVITRNNFLSQVNPYLASVQQRQGLTAFRVIMDESNNPPSVVDQNQLVGQIYLQPTRTAEFIILDFNVLPTGATFPA